MTQPEFRRDPLHNTWVVFAPERQRRPHDFAAAILQPGTLDPFAEGNERLTPPEVQAAREEKSRPNEAGWRVRVVPNRYPAMRVEGALQSSPAGLYDRLTGIGAHEVIIETPDGQAALEDLSPTAITEVLSIYRERIIDLDRDPRFQHIYIFKNVGPSAGASLAHAHSQLVALPLIPPFVEGKLARARDHFLARQRSLFSDILHTERADGTRLVAENDSFLLFCPFASRFPFELAIFPKRHHPDYTSCTPNELQDLAEVLRFALQRLNSVLEKPGYNLLLHTAPLKRPLTERFASTRPRLLLAYGNCPTIQFARRIRDWSRLLHQHRLSGGRRPLPSRGGQAMNVVILWHMHQPYYVNPLTKKAMMPWVRLHAAKGYLDMIDLVTAQPELRVNFNFTPVLVRQILELVNNEVQDEWENLSRKPAAELDDQERCTLLENFFKINWETLVRPVPRYQELLDKRGSTYSSHKLDAIARTFTEQELRDLQTLYNLQWCGFSAVRRFPLLGDLKAKGRDFTEREKNTVLDIHRQILGLVLGEYRAAAERGQIELTTTPYFHPIMPLVYDTNIARRCQPQSPLPSAFSAPEDVRSQLRLAQEQHAKVFGAPARGLWPSEGSIAPEIIPLLVEAGIEYFCTDEGNLFKSLKQDPFWSHRHVEHLELFQGWRVNAGGASIQALFRERPLSDFIGFDAARNETSRAIDHLMGHLHNIAKVAPEGRGVASLILDGENAWEAFPDGGEAFLSSFYRALVEAPGLKTRRLGDYFDEHPSQVETSTLHSGSWIRSDFDIWIGDPEENKGWEWLKETRHFLVERLAHHEVAPERVEAAWWEIYAAEGSDWFWWYGPDFTIDTDFLFDELFRLHLQNVYRILGVEPPAHLDVPICLPSADLGYTKPLRLLEPDLTGKTEHFFDWLGAGELDLTRQATAMFQGDRIGQKLFFGFGPSDFFMRIDLSRQPESIIIRFLLPHSSRVILRKPGTDDAVAFEKSEDGVAFAPAPATGLLAMWGSSLIVSIPRELLAIEPGHEFAFFVQLLEDGLQRERFPERGAIELAAPTKDFDSEQWFV